MRDDDQDDFNGGGLPDFLRDPVGTLRRRWGWMLATLIAGLVGTTVFVLQRQPVYAATATVLVTSQQIREDLVRSTVQEDSVQRINELLNALLSLRSLSALIEKHQLYPELNETLSRADIAARMKGAISIKTVESLGSRERGSSRSSARVFSITFEHADRKVSAVIANELASDFTAESIRARTQQAGLATHFLKTELTRAEKTLGEQNALIRQFKELHRGELPSEFDANVRKLERLQQQRQSLAQQMAEAENRLVTLSVGEVAAGGQSTLSAARQRLQSANSELELSLAQYTEKHPSVVILRRTVARLKAEIAAIPEAEALEDPMQAALPTTIQNTLDQLHTQLLATEAELIELDSRVSRTPANLEELTALEARAGVLRENYLSFLRKVQEAELAQSLEAAQQGSRFSISDRAVPPGRPTKARMSLMMLGALASLGASLGIGLLLEAMDPVIVSKDQIEALGNLRVLGSAPRLA